MATPFPKKRTLDKMENSLKVESFGKQEIVQVELK
jgi:hypothetical protein